MKHYLPLILFLVLVMGGGLAIGFLNTPGEWYAGLAKPAFNPPSWLFAPVWTLVYVLIAVAGWRTFEHDHGGLPMKLWWAQLGLNFFWSPAFFAAHQIGLALVIISLMLTTILAFMATSWREDRMAAFLFMPYAGWVAFATALNAAIFLLN